MKYTISINQKMAFDLKISLDEAIIITCIHDLLPLNAFQKNENNEVWINHDLFRKEYPLLSFGKTTLFKKMASLIERGFLTRTVKKAQSKTMVFYGLTDKSELMFTDSQVHNLNFTGSQNEPAQVHNLNFTGSQNEPNQYTNYHNTNNHNTIIKEKNKKKSENKEREEFFSSIPESLKNKIIEHEELKKNKKSNPKPVDYEYSKYLISKLKKLGNNDFVKMEAIVLQSLERSWTGLFELANEKVNSFKDTTPKPHQELVDFDSIETKPPLTEEELAKFLEEYGSEWNK